MERVVDLFSGCTWWVVSPQQAETLIADLGAEPWGPERPWAGGVWEAVSDSGASNEELAALDARALLVSPQVGEWVVVESRAPRVADADLWTRLSESGPVHQFVTDIWVPWTEFVAYTDGEEVRRYELEFTGPLRDLMERTSGTPIAAEKAPLTMPDPQNGYDAFFYPLGVMHGLGMSVADLDTALDRPAALYLLPA